MNMVYFLKSKEKKYFVEDKEPIIVHENQENEK